MAKSTLGYPSGVPLGMSMCCGQPQPQKLLLSFTSAEALLGGLPVSRSLKDLSNGIVTDDKRESRVI
jgi:hypothetical protein